MQVLVFSQDNSVLKYVEAVDSVIEFEDNHKIMISRLDRFKATSTEKQGIYTVSERHGISFITVVWENDETETFLLLTNDKVCFLYKAGTPTPYIWGVSGGFNRSEAVFGYPKNIRASSVLVENGRFYSAEQINTSIGQAWAEGVRGQGIHEKLFINPPYLTPKLGCTTLYISIGFVSFEKPYLYEENSRPREIRISVADKFSFTAELDDTPNFQAIALPQSVGENDELEIEILDVYPGTKYEDTCINCILYDTLPLE
jgi:hypothetical protein